jgi:hypothetical protein
MNFLNTDVYPVSFLPVDLLWSDLVVVGGVAFGMCVVAALYPALRASRLAPALNQVPLVNVAGVVAILLSVIPVYLATRISSGVVGART